MESLSPQKASSRRDDDARLRERREHFPRRFDSPARFGHRGSSRRSRGVARSRTRGASLGSRTGHPAEAAPRGTGGGAGPRPICFRGERRVRGCVSARGARARDAEGGRHPTSSARSEVDRALSREVRAGRVRRRTRDDPRRRRCRRRRTSRRAMTPRRVPAARTAPFRHVPVASVRLAR